MPLLSVKCPSTTEPLCLAACCCFPLRFFLRGPEIAGRCPVFYPVRCCEGRTRGWDRGGCSSPGHCRCGSRRWQQRSGSGRGSLSPRGSEPRSFGPPPGVPQPCCTPLSSALPLLWPCHNRNLQLPRARCRFVGCEPEGGLLLPSVTLSPLLCSWNVIFVDLFK